MPLSTTTIKRPSYLDRIGYQAGLLAGICAMVSVLILIGYQATHERIAQAFEQDQLNMLAQVLPAHLYNNDLLADARNITALTDAYGDGRLFSAKMDHQATGFAFTLTQEGYSGQIRMIMGLDPEGRILGVRVISHSETPGLGDKIEIAKDPWILSFNGHSLANTPTSDWAVQKDGGQFEAFTGATITPRAVVQAVFDGLNVYARHQHEWLPAPSPPDHESPEQEASNTQTMKQPQAPVPAPDRTQRSKETHANGNQ